MLFVRHVPASWTRKLLRYICNISLFGNCQCIEILSTLVLLLFNISIDCTFYFNRYFLTRHKNNFLFLSFCPTRSREKLLTLFIFLINSPSSWFVQTIQNTPDPVRSRKLSWIGPDQYCGQRWHGKPRWRIFCWADKILNILCHHINQLHLRNYKSTMLLINCVLTCSSSSYIVTSFFTRVKKQLIFNSMVCHLTSLLPFWYHQCLHSRRHPYLFLLYYHRFPYCHQRH